MGDWGNAGTGAATGAALGSVGGPWGAAVGAGVGGIAGYLGYGSGKKVNPHDARWTDSQYLADAARDGASDSSSAIRMGQMLARPDAAQLGQATQLGRIGLGNAAQLDPTQQAQVRALQMQQANRLGQIATGHMQGAGELAAQRQAAQAAAQQQAAARMSRGMSAGTAQRGAARNLASIGVNAAGQAQIAALQDQQAANSQLGALYDQTRGADIGVAGQNAQLGQQAMLQQGQMNQQAMLQQGQFDQERMMQQGMLNQQSSIANADRQLQAYGMDEQTRLAYLAQLANQNQSEMAARLGQQQAAMNQPSTWGPLMQAGAGVLGAYAMRGGGGGGSSGGYAPYGDNTMNPFKR